MFSVEDLLVSHGYKVSKSTLASYQHRTDGYQHEATDSRSGNGILNGFQLDSELVAANSTQTKGLFSDHEKNCVNKRRQISAAGYPRSNQSSDSCHTSEAGVLDRLQSERPCWARTDKDIQYWRRRGQDFSVLFKHGENGAADKPGLPINIDGKKRCNVEEKNTKECHNTVIENVEKTRKKVTVAVKTVEQQTSDGSWEKLEDLLSSNPERSPFVYPSKQKIQFIPKGNSPEGPCHMAITSSSGDNTCIKENKQQDKDNYIVNQDCSKSSFSKPKYSRPSKPPSYEVHQQTWGAVDVGENKDDQQKDEHQSSPKVVDDPEESCAHDSGMEPPNYIPPPSYKSPPLLHAANKPFKKVPRPSDCVRQNISAEKTSTSDKKTICFLGNNGPFTKPASHRHSENCKHSIQYIPFDDPRIKHIAKEAEKHNHSKKHSSTNDPCRVENVNQDSNLHKREQDSAFINPKNLGHHHVKREGIKHKQWLHISIPDQMCCPLPENRDGATACSLPEDSEPTHKLSLKKTHSDSVCETVTKVKKFEPESFVFSKKSSKRKLNETIFCLVSIPVKSDSSPSDICKNNKRLMDNTDRMNMLKHSNAGLPEQRLLSASSSDLELQTLTGNLNNNTELLKQAQFKTEENKQANDLRSGELQHRELTYSGSWPGDQYKDQQTQTVLTDISPLYNGAKESTQSQIVPPTGLIDGRPSAENMRSSVFGIKSQIGFSPSSNSAFSRTSLLLTQIPRTEQPRDLPIVNVDGKGKMVKNDKSEAEEDHACNKKEVFGQFLLKPVNRRPWDAIRELESLNKEFQEPESANSNGEKNVVIEQSKVISMDMSSTRTALRREMLNNSRHIIEVEEVPMFEGLQSKSEKWCTEKITYICERTPAICKFSQAKETKYQPGKLSDGCAPDQKQVQFQRSRDAISTSAPLNIKIDQESLEQSHANKIPPTTKQHVPDALVHHFKEDKTCFDHTFFDVVKVSSAKFGQIGDNMLRKLSLADRNHGRSVPDLSKNFSGTSQNGELFEEHNFLDIPENESLHERAARILGIEVTEDSLVSNGSSEAQSPENVMCDSGAQPEMNVSHKVSEISFSTNEAARIFKSVLHLPVDKEKTVEKLKKLQQDQELSLVCPSVSEQNETNIIRSAEKRLRSTSKMIETLQGKLASTPIRTAVDRLARMKEVDSVSRMRRLSIKSTDSGDELDEEKQLFGTQDGRTRKFSMGSIYKRVISLDESLLITPKGKDKLDLSCADVYDPARVERV
ncbi:PREDICTED: junctional protein associated with coronary artery disease [Nanorana parkeri]|uniref:junctional protein associated with coronary artery disease n=1 Tax=Nanorana parkeri TaxID=125878 RepID=UPI0008542909|nr:PREDICTED: junctional protein associated with coronary artery disease [Nanorana parkeri]